MAYTLTFREDVKGWVSFKSFIYESAISMASNYYSFNSGELYIHHDETVDRNTFYNQPLVPSSFKVIMNSFPDAIKSFNALNYEGSQTKVSEFIEYQVPNDPTWYTDRDYYNLADKDGWYVSNIKTDLQNGVIPEFINKEGKWFNYIKGINITTTIDGQVTGHLDPSEFSFQGLGYVDGVNIFVGVLGCMDSNFIQFNPLANIDDGSCTTLNVLGCMNSTATNYNSLANVNDGSCVIPGCMDSNMSNFNPLATVNDGSCIPWIYGCLNDIAFNYDATANAPCDASSSGCFPPGCTGPAACMGTPGCDGLCCTGVTLGCIDPTAFNYNSNANVSDGSCEYDGCTNCSAYNYCPTCALDCDGNSAQTAFWCCCMTSGCMDSNSVNYDTNNCADCNNVVNGNDTTCCVTCVWGCTTPAATNYNSSATCNDGSCTGVPGCTDPIANNYDPLATNNNGTCEYCASPPTWSLSNETDTTIDVDISTQNTTSPNNALVYTATIEYRITGTSTWTVDTTTATAGPGAPTYTITGLTSSTDYDVQVTGHCSNTDYDAGTNSTATLAIPILGCTEPSACNFNTSANTNDGSCDYILCAGCMDSNANNFNSGDANTWNATGVCRDANGNPSACTIACNNSSPGTGCCTYTILGCMDATTGYNADVNGDAQGATGGPGSYPCLFANNAFVDPWSTDTNCIAVGGAQIGYLASNYDPAVTASGTGGNLSSGLQGLANNGCTYVMGCTDIGTYPSNGTYDYTSIVPSNMREVNGGHYPTAGGSLTPGQAALNYNCSTASNPNSNVSCNDNVGVDDGSCRPLIRGCVDTMAPQDVSFVDGETYTLANWNLGRGCPVPGAGDWPVAPFMDIPVPNFPIGDEWVDANYHDQGCCIRDQEGCIDNSTVTIKQGMVGDINYFISSMTVLGQFMPENDGVQIQTSPTGTAWHETTNELYERLLPNGAWTEGSQWGAYNYMAYSMTTFNSGWVDSNNNPITYDLFDIMHPWSPVNMDACCFSAGCLHPMAYNFDLIGYQYEGWDPSIGGPMGFPSQLNPYYDINENQHRSCAACNGTPAEESFRDYPIGTGGDPSTWDGTLGFNASALGMVTGPYSSWSGAQSSEETSCCCWSIGCTDSNATNWSGGAQCDDGSCCGGAGMPACSGTTGTGGGGA